MCGFLVNLQLSIHGPLAATYSDFLKLEKKKKTVYYNYATDLRCFTRLKIKTIFFFFLILHVNAVRVTVDIHNIWAEKFPA